MEPGVKLGEWEFRRLLGGGTFGKVLLVVHPKMDELIAVKMCQWPDNVVQPKLKAQWKQEVDQMSVVDHPNIVRTKCPSEDLVTLLADYNISKLPMLFTEYCSKGNLRQTLNRPENINGLPEPEVRCLLNDLKDAVKYLHSLKIIHRDIKPENIVLQPAHEPKYSRNHIYKLTDLGLAKNITSDSICDSTAGGLQYFAPELFRKGDPTQAADYWSLGLIAFEVFCGTRPFLPSMAPVQWMSHIKSKSSDQICAYETPKGEVVFSDKIFAENHSSDAFKKLLEKWLRSPLEWDPKKRGNTDKMVTFDLPGEAKAEKDTTDIFTALDNVLGTKIITIFSLPTYEYLSYEIGDETSFTTLQEWIERDTGVTVDDQLFISGVNYDDVKLDDRAMYYWNDRVPIMLFLFGKTCSSLRKTKPKFPPAILPHMENPKLAVKYHHYMKTVGDMFYFVTDQRRLYESYASGTINRFEYLKNIVNRIYVEQIKTDKEISALVQKSDLLAEIICLDEKMNVNDDLDELNAWISKMKLLHADVTKLKDVWNQFGTRLESVTRRCNEINAKDIYSEKNNVELCELHQAAYALVSAARALPNNDRGHLKSCYEAVKLLYKCLKIRDKLLSDIDNQKVSQKIADIHTETGKMDSLISGIAKNAQILSADVSKGIVDKQNIFWKIVNSKTNTVEDRSPPRSLASFKVGGPVRSKIPIGDDHRRIELQALINESNALRMNSIAVIQQMDSLQATMKKEINYEFEMLKFD